jgi:hypothetical protein
MAVHLRAETSTEMRRYQPGHLPGMATFLDSRDVPASAQALYPVVPQLCAGADVPLPCCDWAIVLLTFVVEPQRRHKLRTAACAWNNLELSRITGAPC